MTATPDYDALTARMEEILDAGKIDAVAAPNLILILADAFDRDAIATLRTIQTLPNHSPETLLAQDKFTQILFDILETSQSNFNRSVEDLIEVLTIDAQINDPEFR